MNKPGLGVAPEGAPIIGFLALCSLCFAFLEWWPAVLLALLLEFFSLHFFRDPERVVPQEEGAAVSPADGKIIRREMREDPLSGERKECLSIFMNVFSVHINRSPVEGKVEAVRYLPGKFFNAAWDKASTDNEQCIWHVASPKDGGWTFVQIAGLVARRIVPHAEQGDLLRRGQRFGLIRFGSRVDVYLPEGYAPAVGIGDQVFAGQTVIARKIERKGEMA